MSRDYSAYKPIAQFKRRPIIANVHLWVAHLRDLSF
jgi:hypothetical protein